VEEGEHGGNANLGVRPEVDCRSDCEGKSRVSASDSCLVYDQSGYLVAFCRVDGAPLRSIQISQNKAYAAVRMGVPTDQFLARLRKDQLQASDFGENLTPLPGGNPLIGAGGKVLGAIGVSGLALSEDQSIRSNVGWSSRELRRRVKDSNCDALTRVKNI
jgi:glc operon protein GlcG